MEMEIVLKKLKNGFLEIKARFDERLEEQLDRIVYDNEDENAIKDLHPVLEMIQKIGYSPIDYDLVGGLITIFCLPKAIADIWREVKGPLCFPRYP